MSGLIPVREFSSAAEVIANAAAIRKSLWEAKPGVEQKPEPKVMLPAPAKPRIHVTIALPKALAKNELPDGFAKLLFSRHSLPYWYEKMPVRAADVLRLASNVCGVTHEDILAHRRTKLPTQARQLACWLARRFTGKSLPEIGRVLGGRDHTTVLHAIRATEARLGEHAADISLLPVEKAAVAAWQLICGEGQ